MAELRARLKPLFRRSSTTSSKSSASSTITALGERRGHSKSSLLLSKSRKSSLPTQVNEEEPPLPLPPGSILGSETQSIVYDPPQTPDTSLETPRLTPLEKSNPTLTLEEPTPDLTPAIPAKDSVPHPVPDPTLDPAPTPDPNTTSTPRPTTLPRRQSLANNTQSRFLHTLLETGTEKPEPVAAPAAASSDYFASGPMTVSANMLHRKIWVKRASQAATMVTISEDDLVDDAKDMILKKYTNSLGRHFDAPDVTLKIKPRESAHRHGKAERTLGPEEQLSRTLDAYFPGGQNVDEALIIDVPQRRTPRHSPHIQLPYYAHDDLRPSESGGDYFPTVPVQGQHSPRLPSTVSVASAHAPAHPPLSHAMSVVGSGQLPPLPSPGQLSARHSSSAGSRSARPRYPRQQTASPTVLGMTKSVTHGGQAQFI